MFTKTDLSQKDFSVIFFIGQVLGHLDCIIQYDPDMGVTPDLIDGAAERMSVRSFGSSSDSCDTCGLPVVCRHEIMALRIV